MATKSQKLLAAGAAVLVAEPVLAMAHTGGIGAIIGLAIGAAAYNLVDEYEHVTGKELPLPVPTPPKKAPEQLPFVYRLFNGKSAREEQVAAIAGPARSSMPVQRLAQDDVFNFDGVDDLIRPRVSGGVFLFSDVLSGFTPTIEKIFLARTSDGTLLFCHARDLCHVALAGSTGNGKSSIMRMLMLQLCRAGARVLLLNPHYTRYDIENDEDWTPFEPYLVHPPMECRNYAVIERYLKAAATDLIPARLEKRANSQPVGKPYFIVIDELPSIVREVKNAPDYMRVILEEGRKVGVLLISAAQDFLVKTISPDSGGGSIRECYRTAYYVGGDPTTAKVLLDMQPKLIQEDQMGKGTVMLRSAACKKAIQVHVPYVDNASLYHLLGPSTYNRAAGDDTVEMRKVFEQSALQPPSSPALPTVPTYAPTGHFTAAPSPELQRAIEAYRAGATSYRKLGEALNIDKDAAGKLIRELQRRKLIDG